MNNFRPLETFANNHVTPISSGALNWVDCSNVEWGINTVKETTEQPREYNRFADLNLDTSKVVPTSNENRPYNIMLLPLISY